MVPNRQKKVKKQPVRKRADDIDAGDVKAINRVKTRNRLVGDLANNGIYDSDDGDHQDCGASASLEYLGSAHNSMDGFTEGVLDLGLKKDANAPKKQFNFFNKAANARKSAKVAEGDLNSKIQRLGFTKATNVNELAARGVKLNFRDTLIQKLKSEEQEKLHAEAAEGQKFVESTSVSQPDSATLKLKTMVDKFCKDVHERYPEQAKARKPVQVQASAETSRKSGKVGADEDDDDDELEFIDPVAVQRAKLAEAQAEKEQSAKNQMVMMNGKLVSIHNVSLNARPGAAAISAQGQQNARSAFLSQLRD